MSTYNNFIRNDDKIYNYKEYTDKIIKEFDLPKYTDKIFTSNVPKTPEDRVRELEYLSDNARARLAAQSEEINELYKKLQVTGLIIKDLQDRIKALENLASIGTDPVINLRR